MAPFSFCIEAKDNTSKARAGRIHTAHGVIETPAFVAVGTNATVKGVLPEMLTQAGVQAVIANTYHLFLEPGASLVANRGGLGNFMNFQGPTMTDSGGFQVFSLGAAFNKAVHKVLPNKESAPQEDGLSALAYFDESVLSEHAGLVQIDEEGVSFTNHRDGALHRFTPERSIELQHALGADILFAFDECTSAQATYDYQQEAMHRTHRWARRSLAAHRGNLDAGLHQALFGVVQGGRFGDLRRESAQELASMDFDGFGIGGSYTKADIDTIVGVVTDILPEEKPRHLLGIGEPEDIRAAVRQGVDLFDCVQPTRLGRTGMVYTTGDRKIHLRREEYRNDSRPIMDTCPCYACAHVSRAYLAHLFHAREMLGPMLASLHNLTYIASVASGERKRIRESR